MYRLYKPAVMAISQISTKTTQHTTGNGWVGVWGCATVVPDNGHLQRQAENSTCF